VPEFTSATAEPAEPRRLAGGMSCLAGGRTPRSASSRRPARLPARSAAG